MTTPAVSESNKSLKQILAPVSADIVRIDDTLRSVATLDFPLVRQGIEAIIAAGGKRLRPAILFLAARFNKYDSDRVVPMAAAIELLHTASLVHDDTIDNALVRRGLPTLNSMIDEGTTVLVGDYLFAKAAVLSTMGGVLRATRIFAESLVTISEGEIEQKFSIHHVNADLDNYYKRIYSKTGVLFAAASEIGAVLSEAPEDQVRALRQYGRQLGMAFQIVDDILDFSSTTEQLGKPAGGDLRQGTVTLPTMLFLEAASEADRAQVRRAVEDAGRTDELVEDTIAKIKASDALRRAGATAHDLVQQAKDSLGGFPDIAEKQSLLDLADFAIRRAF